MAEADKDDWLDDLEAPEAATPGSPDQSDIDALFASVEEPAPAAPQGEAADELDQSAIDALLSGGNEVDPFAAPAPAAPAEEGAASELDQSDIDALLASPQLPVQDQSLPEPDQDEIDRLFAEVDAVDTTADTPFPPAEADFKDILEGPEPAGQPKASEDFDSDEFALDVDIPDIPDTLGFEPAPSATTMPFEPPLPPPAVEQPTAVIAPSPAAEPAEARAAESAPSRKGLAFLAPLLMAKRKLLYGAAGGLLVLLLGVAGVLFFTRRGAEPPPPAPAEQAAAPEAEAPVAEHAEAPPAEPAAPSPPPTPAAPSLGDLDLTMAPEAKELAITLKGADPENKALQYDFITMPSHGQLAGHAPNLIYVPQPDFSGQDYFAVKVSNGKLSSPPATIRITRTAAAASKEAEKPAPVAAAAPAVKTEDKGEVAAVAGEEHKEGETGQEKPIKAKGTSYSLTSGQRLTISWKKLWQAANQEPYGPEVQVDILKAPKHGDVRASKGHSAIYVPSKDFAGADSLSYRFRLGKRSSAAQTIGLHVQRPVRPPQIRLQALAPDYETGDLVVLNASPSAAANPGPLTYRWEQQSGVPVVLKALNAEESRVSFVAPSTFNTVSKPSLSFRLTVTNADGLESSQEISVHTKSRRKSAIWRSGRD